MRPIIISILYRIYPLGVVLSIVNQLIKFWMLLLYGMLELSEQFLWSSFLEWGIEQPLSEPAVVSIHTFLLASTE